MIDVQVVEVQIPGVQGATGEQGPPGEPSPDLDEILAAQAAAEAAAAEAEANAAAADADRIAAEAARVAAEAARDAAIGAGNIYPDTTAGLAATADGGYFSVPASSVNDSLILYREVAGVATEIKRYPTTAAVDAVYKLEVLGRPIGTTMVTGTGAAGNDTQVFSTPMTRNGILRTVRAWANVAGIVSLSRWTKSGDVFTMVGAQYLVPLAVGDNTIQIDDDTGFGLKAGEYLGFYASAVVKYLVGTPATPYYSSGANNVLTFTDATVGSTLQWQLSCEFATGTTADLEVDAGLAIYDGFTVGKRLLPVAAASSATANTVFVLDAPASASGKAVGLRMAGVAGGGNIVLKRFNKEGDLFTQRGDDVTVPFVAGVNFFIEEQLGNFSIQAGEYLGVYSTVALLYLTTGTLDNTFGFYDAGNGSGNIRSFTDIGPVTPAAFQLGIDFVSSEVDENGMRLTDMEDALLTPAWLAGDVITEATAIASGMNVTVTATLDRLGARQTISNTVAITATTSTNIRHDIIYLDKLALTIGVVDGTERANDPTAFIPAIGASTRLPLFLSRTLSGAVATVPVWRVYDGVDKDLTTIIQRETTRSHMLLPKTMAKIRARLPLRLLGFGDSTTAIQSAAPSSSVPNGTVRDVGATPLASTDHYLRDAYGADVVDALPLYTSVQLGRADDGGGAIHTKIGWNWELMAALVAAGYTLGTDLFYDNLGLGGASSANAVVGTTPQGWLTAAAALSPKPDIAVVALGMNERGDALTEGRIAVIVDTFQAAGIEVLVLDCPRPRAATSGVTLTNWLYTNRAIRRAAEYAGAAHLSLTPLYDVRYIQACGVHVTDTCASNKNNHPGMEEHRAIGRELVRLLTG